MVFEDLLMHILSNTFTKNDCYKRLLVVQEFISHEHFAASASTDRPTEHLRARFADTQDRETTESVVEWGDEFLKAVDDPTGSVIENLKRLVGTKPDLVLYVPIILEQSHIRAIGEWCRKNIDPGLFLDLRVDRATAGGCIVVWKNVLYDLSLEYFMRKHEKELAQMIATILPSDQKRQVAA